MFHDICCNEVLDGIIIIGWMQTTPLISKWTERERERDGEITHWVWIVEWSVAGWKGYLVHHDSTQRPAPERDTRLELVAVGVDIVK